jgi:hypothetical protein
MTFHRNLEYNLIVVVVFLLTYVDVAAINQYYCQQRCHDPTTR